MIRTAFALLTLAVLAAIDTRPAAAEIYRPWCVVYSGRDGAYTCIFTSFDQCMMTATPGTGGSCVQNPWYARYGEQGRGQEVGERRRPSGNEARRRSRRKDQVRLIVSRPPTRPMTVLAPIAITNRMISSAYICGMLKML
jgi:hypothetical protein